ncbi:hypothetical protein Metho_0999 [Methanomethylovorans hollandica DSM 15978]|uniref:DUF7847 domain-containing protein n=1 Tax=Methanomethylovorans hollandica (strain DSM 15978 / NBRC 107637 / DMS1) TaxID=867904 RepID=L0KYT5_METHD|nr:hypothetical protein [Methanomethylovorans hollandica]AGB49238.1 hypothetical protein Metho_0999 [Methanomethylovorans hollandica DSM 15978]
MHEDLGTLLNKGYRTWNRNMIIAVPFILDMMATIIFSLFAVTIFLMIFVVPEIASSTIAGDVPPEVYLEILGSLLKENLLLLVAGALFLLILFLFIGSFFEAGAIGMCRLALLSGDTSVGQMWASARHHVLNLMFAKILVALIIMAGVVFLVPGILIAGDLGSLGSDPTSTGSILLAVGMLVWFLYALVAGILLFFVEYALVVDDLDPISALEKSLEFFKDNKAGVISIIGIIVAISLGLEIFGSAISSVEALSDVWSLVYLFLSVIVIRPLTTTWIARMYMDRTGKELYSFDIYNFE